ncbi:MAG: phage holin family protein [Clostridia bacterium]|nr:phage holin family protein [Clostridia bacterium]
MWKKITEILAAVAGAIASFFTTMPPLVYVLIGVMSIDFLTGLMCGALGKSKKTENGYLASHEAFRGLMKKMLIILVVVLAACLDYAVSLGAGITFEAVMGATCLWFIASEGLSILENVASMGVPVPAILLNLLEIMRKKGDGQQEVKKPEKTEEPTDAE